MSARITSADPENSGMSEDEFANLSDDEIMNMQIPPAFSTSGEEAGDPDDDADTATLSTDDSEEEEDEVNPLGQADDEDEADPDEAGDDDTGSQEDDYDPAGSDDTDEGNEPFVDGDSDPKAKDEKPAKKKVDEAADKATEPKTGEVDYKSAYEKIFTPFKANGREVKVNSPEEAVELMQMGANYTKKLMALKPHLKMVKMLENQGLLDESKLSYLIDLSKGNKDAVQRLVKDSGIDPMEIDTDKETGYKPGNYQVSDEEMEFKSTLEDVSSNPDGKEVIRHINKSWDAKSKEALWSQPALLKVLTTQKANGLFDQISGEVDRRQMLGQLNGISYIEAYYAVGQEMDQAGQLKSGETQSTLHVDNVQRQPEQNRPLETRKVVKKKVDDSARVKAASPMKTQTKAVKEEFNPLAMSDEEFEKRANLGTRF